MTKYDGPQAKVDGKLEIQITIKITGGPDGDVAGNMMRILERDYGKNAVIVGVGDGSGSGEDPEGLDHAELIRLFNEGLPIASFDKTKLSPKGRVVSVDEPEGHCQKATEHNRYPTALSCRRFISVDPSAIRLALA